MGGRTINKSCCPHERDWWVSRCCFCYASTFLENWNDIVPLAALCKCFVSGIPPFHAEWLLCLPLFTERLRLLYCVLVLDQVPLVEGDSQSGEEWMLVTAALGCRWQQTDCEDRVIPCIFYYYVSGPIRSATKNMHVNSSKMRIELNILESPTFHMEDVCLCGVSLGQYLSRFVFFKGEETGSGTLAPAVR